MFGNWKPSISFSCGYNVEALQGWLETLEIGICMARNWRSLNVAGGIRKILIWIFVARAARELYLNQPTDESYNAKIWVPTFPEYYSGIGLRKNQKEALHLVVIPSFPVSILRWASMEVTSGILIRGFSILAGLAITRIGNKMKVSKVMGDPQVTTAMPQLFQLLSHGCHNWMIWRSPIWRRPHIDRDTLLLRPQVAMSRQNDGKWIGITIHKWPNFGHRVGASHPGLPIKVQDRPFHVMLVILYLIHAYPDRCIVRIS